MAYKTVREAEDATANKLGMGEAQRAVYDVIRRNRDVTNREIAGILGWEINRVTGRTHELRKMGLVAEGRKRPCTRAEGDQLVQAWTAIRSEEHTSELQSRGHLVCRLLLEK